MLGFANFKLIGSELLWFLDYICYSLFHDCCEKGVDVPPRVMLAMPCE